MDLFEAFQLRSGSIVAVVGGGGKTSLVYALAREAAGRSLAALATTTTMFTKPREGGLPENVLEATDETLGGLLAGVVAPGAWVLAHAGIGRRQRYMGFQPQTIDGLSALNLALVVVEADGSAQRAFKAPAAHEPVIPAAATHVIVCVGLGVLGKTLDEVNVHRPEIVARLADAAIGDVVTASMVACTLLHEEGGRKGVPAGAKLMALLNQPLTAEHERLGVHMAQRLVYGGYDRAVMATAHEDVVHAVVG